MTIGIDASRANRVEKTGIEWYAYRLLQAMKQITRGTLVATRVPLVDFLLYTDMPLRDDLAELPSGWEERVLAWPPKKFWTQGRLSLEMLFRAPDLLFIPSHVIPVLHPKRVVFTCHDIGFERRPELYPAAERAYHRLTMRYGVRAATHIIAVSEFTQQELMDVYKIPSEKITVIHHGFYGSSSNGSAAVSNNPHQLPLDGRGKGYLLYVGRIEAKKNLDVIIDAFAQLKREKKIPDDMQLVLVGRRGYQSERILAHAASLSHDDIIYHPWVPPETLHALYANARAFLFPSLYEGFGFPLLEALSYGLPVIASDIPALREIGGAHAVFVTPTASGFAEAIPAALERPLKADAKTHLTQFSWKIAAQKTLTVLHNSL